MEVALQPVWIKTQNEKMHAPRLVRRRVWKQLFTIPKNSLVFLLFGKAPPDAPVTFWKERKKEKIDKKEEEEEEEEEESFF